MIGKTISHYPPEAYPPMAGKLAKKIGGRVGGGGKRELYRADAAGLEHITTPMLLSSSWTRIIKFKV